MTVALVSFSLAALLIVLLPGPDTLVVIRGMVRSGRAGGVRTAAGVLCGLLVWVAAAVLGLSALLRASEVGYDVLKAVGALYLMWMGVQSLRSIRRSAAALSATSETAVAPSGRGGGFIAGFLTDVLNPKVGVFFVSFLPGFVPEGASVAGSTLLFGAVYVVLTAIYFVLLVLAAGTIASWMQTPRIRHRLDAITGTVLIGFGLRLATEG